MASIHRDPRNDNFLLMFRYGSKQYRKSLKTTDADEADALKGKVEVVLLELERGRRTLPPDADIWQFLISDGQRTQKTEAPTVTSLEQLFGQYEAGLPPGAMEANSLATIRIHRNHLVRILGGRTAVPSLTTTIVQGYINTRSREKYRGKLLSSRTIKKEVTTLRSVWNWGKEHALVNADAPTKGLRYEKEEDKPDFMTWEEIQRQVARGGLSKGQVKVLWDALFLSTEQVAECLEYVRSVAAAPFVFPMFVFVAHTGARRSEVVRSRVEDIDFDANRTRIREKKKNKTKKETWRYVELSPLLKQVMGTWLREQHPGGHTVLR